MQTTLPGLVNAHIHSPYGPQCTGVTRSRSFEAWMIDIMIRQDGRHSPEEAEACALVTGLENIAAGNTALIDQCSIPQTREHAYAIARAYEALGLRAWVFVNVSDLPSIIYVKEAFSGYDQALPATSLPEPLKVINQPPRDYRDQLDDVADIIRNWPGERVKIGLGLTNPVWCSDDLLHDAAALADQVGSPIEIHAEESPVQREVHFAQWGMSGIERLALLGVLSPRTLIAHVVQVDDKDIHLLSKHGCSISHNPISNLKLQNGIAPIGKMLDAGMNVCLGSDGQSSADSQNLFEVMKFTAALADYNGLRDVEGVVEEIVLKLATTNGYRLWFEGDPSSDYIEFSSSIGEYAHVWGSPAAQIEEVIIDGSPRLEAARSLVEARGAYRTIANMMERLSAPEKRHLVEEYADPFAQGQPERSGSGAT
jgi:5-methylthioadenosine/S-adenosylhomocysteine deaminase